MCPYFSHLSLKSDQKVADELIRHTYLKNYCFGQLRVAGSNGELSISTSGFISQVRAVEW
jgi:hypothetical protein